MGVGRSSGRMLEKDTVSNLQDRLKYLEAVCASRRAQLAAQRPCQ